MPPVIHSTSGDIDGIVIHTIPTIQKIIEIKTYPSLAIRIFFNIFTSILFFCLNSTYYFILLLWANIFYISKNQANLTCLSGFIQSPRSIKASHCRHKFRQREAFAYLFIMEKNMIISIFSNSNNMIFFQQFFHICVFDKF